MPFDATGRGYSPMIFDEHALAAPAVEFSVEIRSQGPKSRRPSVRASTPPEQRVRKTLDPHRVRQYLTRREDHGFDEGPDHPPRRDPAAGWNRAGARVQIKRIDRGEYRLVRLEPRPNQGLVKLLLACPVKGWFKPVEQTRRPGT